MSFNGKHLSLEDRKIIEENINKGLRKFETAKELNKNQSTIGKEIKNNRKRRYSQAEDVPKNANITMNVKSALECVLISKKSHVWEEISLLVHVILLGNKTL